MNTEQIKNLDNENIMHTYGRDNVALNKGQGATVTDVEGKEYIDTASGIGVNSVGYCNDGWINAVTDQLHKLQHGSNYYYNEVVSTLAEKLCSVTPFDKVFFGNSGAEANECAIKLARKYSFDKYGKERTTIITLKNSFHGRTITALSATGQDVFHNYFFPFTPGFKYAEANNFEDMLSNVDDTVCAIMIELIQGEGGVNILEKDYVQKIRKLCDEKDIVLIVDEVQTGAGRTGKLYCFENYDIVPDVCTSAKGIGGGLPIGICMCTEKYANVMTPSTHGTTYGGNPVCCAGALYVLNEISDENFLKEVREKGEYFENKLRTVKGVKDVRRMGLMIGIELEKDNAGEIAKKCLENGLLIITAKTLLRMLPPLVITYEEIDKAVSILEKTITEE